MGPARQNISLPAAVLWRQWLLQVPRQCAARRFGSGELTSEPHPSDTEILTGAPLNLHRAPDKPVGKHQANQVAFPTELEHRHQTKEWHICLSLGNSYTHPVNSNKLSPGIWPKLHEFQAQQQKLGDRIRGKLRDEFVYIEMSTAVLSPSFLCFYPTKPFPMSPAESGTRAQPMCNGRTSHLSVWDQLHRGLSAGKEKQPFCVSNDDSETDP